jgi:hypothetical protein
MKRTPTNTIAWWNFIEALGKHGLGVTAMDLVEITGWNIDTVRYHLRVARQLQKIRIVWWRRQANRTGGHISPCYSLGNPKFDVLRPKPLTRQEQCKRYRQRQKERRIEDRRVSVDRRVFKDGKRVA